MSQTYENSIIRNIYSKHVPLMSSPTPTSGTDLISSDNNLISKSLSRDTSSILEFNSVSSDFKPDYTPTTNALFSIVNHCGNTHVKDANFCIKIEPNTTETDSNTYNGESAIVQTGVGNEISIDSGKLSIDVVKSSVYVKSLPASNDCCSQPGKKSIVYPFHMLFASIYL